MKSLRARWRLIFLGAFWLFGMLRPGLPVSARSGPAVVRPDPLIFEVELGQVKILDIFLENPNNVYGIDVQGQFDPQAIEVVDANPARAGIQLIPGTVPKPDFVVVNTADNTLGTFRYASTQINPTPPANAAGIVVKLQVLGKMTGESVLAITSVKIADPDGVDLPVTTQSGIIRVVPTTGNFFLFLPLLTK